MARDAKLQELERQLSRYSLGPVDDVINQASHTATIMISQLTAFLRQAAFDHPLTVLFLSCEAGYIVGRWGRKHARVPPAVSGTPV